MNLVAPDEHQLLVFWTQFAVLLLAARALGQLMKRAGQPAVVGELGGRVRTVARSGSSTAAEIVALAAEEEVDLVVLGANLRQIEGRPFLGNVVEEVLEDCDATVVVVATPSGPYG